MVEQSNGQSKAETPSEDYRRGRRGTFVIALVAVALLAGLTGNLLSKAFGQGDGWHHIAWHDGGMFGGPLSPAQIDDRIDRMTKHSAIERLRAEQIGLAETASKRIAQALADAADVLSPEQRRKVADWIAFGRPWWARWHRG